MRCPGGCSTSSSRTPRASTVGPTGLGCRWPFRSRPPGASVQPAALDASESKLLLEHPLFEIGLAVEQQSHRDVAVLVYLDRLHVARLAEIRDGTDRPLVGLERLYLHPRLVRQERAAPAAWAERADRGQREHAGAERDDRAVCGKIVGGAANRGAIHVAVSHQLLDPHHPVDADPQLCRLPALTQQ